MSTINSNSSKVRRARNARRQSVESKAPKDEMNNNCGVMALNDYLSTKKKNNLSH